MMGARGDEAKNIVRKSHEIVKKFVKGNSPEDLILKRCIIATGDPSVKDLIVFKGNPVDAGIKALERGAKIVVDVSMVKAGIRYHDVVVAVEHADLDADVRVRDGFYRLRNLIDGNIVAIGNSPAGAMAVYDLCKEGFKPALIIATPVGFVNADRAKELIRSLDVPSITTVGSRGGSNICVAVLNTIIDIARERGQIKRGRGVVIVGVGASQGFLTERAIEEIRRADVIYGSRRAIELAKKYVSGKVVELKSFGKDVYRRIEEDGRRRRVVVLSTGDPMVVGLGKKIRGEVIPGISSVQLALARLGVDLTEVVVIDGHARDCIDEVKKAFKIGRYALIVADSNFNVKRLMDFANVTVLENLGYMNERICENCEIKSDLVILFAKRR